MAIRRQWLWRQQGRWGREHGAVGGEWGRVGQGPRRGIKSAGAVAVEPAAERPHVRRACAAPSAGAVVTAVGLNGRPSLAAGPTQTRPTGPFGRRGAADGAPGCGGCGCARLSARNVPCRPHFDWSEHFRGAMRGAVGGWRQGGAARMCRGAQWRNHSPGFVEAVRAKVCTVLTNMQRVKEKG